MHNFHCWVRYLWTPVILNALGDELLFSETRVFRVALGVKTVSFPHVTSMVMSVFTVLILSDAQHKHCLLVLELFKVKDCGRFVCLWVIVKLWFKSLLHLNFVLIDIHLFDDWNALGCWFCVFELKKVKKKDAYVNSFTVPLRYGGISLRWSG